MEIQETLGTGLIFSPPDSRDALAGAFLGEVKHTFPEEFELPQILGVKDQNGFPSCVFQTIARWIEYANAKEGRPAFNSARYGYALSKSLDGQPTLEGTFTRIGLKVANDIGDTLEADWPEDHTITYAEYIKLPPSNLAPKAAPYRINGYIVFENIDQVKQFIWDYQLPVIIGVNSNNTGWGTEVVKNNNYVLQEPTGGRSGHQLLGVGWKKDIGLRFENSWSLNWGQNGRATVPYNYSGLSTQIFCPFDLPNNWPSLVTSYKEKLWKQSEIIKAWWKVLEVFGWPPISQVDISIHMKAKSPMEMISGFADALRKWRDDHNV